LLLIKRRRTVQQLPQLQGLDYHRASTLITCRAVQAPPRADFTPRAVSARATPRKLFTPLACICRMIGTTLAA
jgi:hypothetical protein